MKLTGASKIGLKIVQSAFWLFACLLSGGIAAGQGRVAGEWSLRGADLIAADLTRSDSPASEVPVGSPGSDFNPTHAMLLSSNRDAAMRLPARRFAPFSRVGIGARVGVNGIGFDVATPVAGRFNLRIGGDFFSYSDSFAEEGANVAASVRLMSGHGALDWFPFGNSFRISPLVVVGNGNRVRATAVVPGGSNITIGGGNYISSNTDPLHGDGSVAFRKTAPGISVGFGNLVPRSRKHFSFPVETGFFYVGQPSLKVAFSGSACNPTQPVAVGCQSVDSDADFQSSLNAFRLRNNNNLKYASFYPIFSTGVGYRF